ARRWNSPDPCGGLLQPPGGSAQTLDRGGQGRRTNRTTSAGQRKAGKLIGAPRRVRSGVLLRSVPARTRRRRLDWPEAPSSCRRSEGLPSATEGLAHLRRLGPCLRTWSGGDSNSRPLRARDKDSTAALCTPAGKMASDLG